MTCANHNRFLLPAWGVSLTLHGVLVVLAVLFAARVRPIIEEQPFKWDVALVEAVKTDSAPEVSEPVAPPVQRPPRVASRPVEPTDTVMHRVAPRESVQMVHPEPPKPVEEREAPVSVTKPLPEKTVEPIEQQVVETPKTRPEPVTAAKEPEPIQATEPVIAQQAVAPQAESVEQQPVETPVKPLAPESVASSSPEPPAVPSPPTSAAAEAPAQVAKAAPPGPEARTDHRWLAESLWRRVAELKRYPTSARLNGQEGKVILKAVIRSDGHLAEVSVQKSSGHHILDAAAMEAVKLACPLHMKHAISKPEIVVSLPIVYSLAN
ncbi:MAG TPA: energy transducer TonB [Nitrospira sp.]|nr:energy transducer TonB [Nitrospira sp.]